MVPEILIVTVAGFGAGLALIVAIGAQNAFVLRQGIRRKHVLPVVAVCAVSDAVLISAGISGIGAVVARWPMAFTVAAWVGGAFLVGYGLLAARRAWRPSGWEVDAAARGTARGVVLTCLALTWLNPHVYLDTVLLLGSLANSYGPRRWLFGVGAGLASMAWFAALGYGARLLRGLFARAAAWRVLDACIAATMSALGVAMVLTA